MSISTRIPLHDVSYGQPEAHSWRVVDPEMRRLCGSVFPYVLCEPIGSADGASTRRARMAAQVAAVGRGAFSVIARDPPAAPRYKYSICTYAVDKLIRKHKAKGDTHEYFVRWLCAPRSSRLEALRPRLAGHAGSWQLAIRGTSAISSCALCACASRVDRAIGMDRHIAVWPCGAIRPSAGRIHARGMCGCGCGRCRGRGPPC